MKERKHETPDEQRLRVWRLLQAKDFANAKRLRDYYERLDAHLTAARRSQN